MTAETQPNSGGDGPRVYVEVSGLTGTGKSAIMGEIEIALHALGVPVDHDADFQSEKNMTHADWQTAIDLYKPTVVIRERNVSRAPPTMGGVPVAWRWQSPDGSYTTWHHPDEPPIDVAQPLYATPSALERWDSPLWKDAEPTAHVMNRLRQCLAAQPTQTEGWQPIETHDGSESPVLVATEKRVGEAFLHETWIAPDGVTDEDAEGPWPEWSWTYHSTCGCCRGPITEDVTHWMPLPPAPDTTSPASQEGEE